jgi:hypothetical protein
MADAGGGGLLTVTIPFNSETMIQAIVGDDNSMANLLGHLKWFVIPAVVAGAVIGAIGAIVMQPDPQYDWPFIQVPDGEGGLRWTLPPGQQQ